MTVTEELRRMLDERGVKWSESFYPDSRFTRWESRGVVWNACDLDDGILLNSSDRITPEDVIAATVGEGTCHNTQFAEMDEKADKKHRRAIASVLYDGIFPEDEPAEFTCSACGKTALIDWVTLYDISFCPFCGAKVVEE